MSAKTIISSSPRMTRKSGADFAKYLINNPLGDKALVVALIGDLGSGKTTLLRGFARGLGVKEKILSPTFIIFRKLEIKGLYFRFLYHFDCYRIGAPKDLLALGWKEIVKNPQNIIVVEWADRVSKIIPKNAVRVELRRKGECSREIKLKQQKTARSVI